jgi:hypothetical protein
MQRSLFVFAFGLSLFVAQADDSVKQLGKGAVVQVPPQDYRGSALYARVTLILDKDGNPIPSNSQDVPIIKIGYDVDLESALIAVAVRTGGATDVSMAVVSGLIIEASDGDVVEEGEDEAEIPDGVIIHDIDGSDGDEPEAQTLSVTEAYEDELVLPDGIIVEYIQGAAAVRVSRGVVVQKSCSMDILQATHDADTYVAVLEVTWNGNVYLYHFTKEPQWSPRWWYWHGEFWYKDGEWFYPSYHNCPSFPDYSMYCYDWPRF